MASRTENGNWKLDEAEAGPGLLQAQYCGHKSIVVITKQDYSTTQRVRIRQQQ